eukprot:1367955-Amorphochlora_amoeboformis.AAC.1
MQNHQSMRDYSKYHKLGFLGLIRIHRQYPLLPLSDYVTPPRITLWVPAGPPWPCEQPFSPGPPASREDFTRNFRPKKY